MERENNILADFLVGLLVTILAPITMIILIGWVFRFIYNNNFRLNSNTSLQEEPIEDSITSLQEEPIEEPVKFNESLWQNNFVIDKKPEPEVCCFEKCNKIGTHRKKIAMYGQKDKIVWFCDEHY